MPLNSFWGYNPALHNLINALLFNKLRYFYRR
nr:MAG TPA: hypothetical protein [Caudoviricetes sp.]